MASSRQTPDSDKREIEYYNNRVRLSNLSKDVGIFKISNDVPEYIGLGLFHHKHSSKEVQEKKERALMEMANIPGMNEQKLIQAVDDLLKEIIGCYDQSDEMTRCDLPLEQLPRMFAMDACFILKFFTDGDGRLDIVRKRMMQDIFKLENQIPLFLLLKIMELQYNNTDEATNAFAKMLSSNLPFETVFPLKISPEEVIAYLEKTLLLEKQRRQKVCRVPLLKRQKCHHLLHLLIKSSAHFLSQGMQASSIGGVTTPDYDRYHHHLEELQNYRVSFEASQKEVRIKKRWLLSNILYLPRINLAEDKEPLFWNLMNFADVLHEDKSICDLMYLMDCIVKENNELLFRKAGIIQGKSETPTDFFIRIRTLCTNIREDAGQYQQLMNQLVEHCEYPPNRWMFQVCEFFKKHFSLIFVVTILVQVIDFVIGYLKK